MTPQLARHLTRTGTENPGGGGTTGQHGTHPPMLPSLATVGLRPGDEQLRSRRAMQGQLTEVRCAQMRGTDHRKASSLPHSPHSSHLRSRLLLLGSRSYTSLRSPASRACRTTAVMGRTASRSTWGSCCRQGLPPWQGGRSEPAPPLAEAASPDGRKGGEVSRRQERGKRRGKRKCEGANA